MKRKVEKLPEQERQELLDILETVRDCIQDGNQNIKDALVVLSSLEKNLGIVEPKPTLFQRLVRFLAAK